MKFGNLPLDPFPFGIERSVADRIYKRLQRIGKIIMEVTGSLSVPNGKGGGKGFFPARRVAAQ
jgi:hypothetical protein